MYTNIRSRLVRIRAITIRASNGYMHRAHMRTAGARASGVDDVAQALAHQEVPDLVGRARGAPPARRRPRLLHAGAALAVARGGALVRHPRGPAPPQALPHERQHAAPHSSEPTQENCATTVYGSSVSFTPWRAPSSKPCSLIYIHTTGRLGSL